MSLTDVVRKTESKINEFNTHRSRKAGWIPTVTGYTGYGNADQLRVFARVLMRSTKSEPRTAALRGFRQFFTIQVGNCPIRVTVNGQSIEAMTDRNGYVEVLVNNHGLEPGWHEVTIETVTSKSEEFAEEFSDSTTAEVLILDPDTKVGIISDVDDTVIVTMLPRALLAAYNSWFVRTDKRKAVPGFNEFYAELRNREPNVPVFYLSTGAWNTFDTLCRFFASHGLPKGPLLLTDWGPTQTGLFRSGQEHKKVQLRNLLIDFPDVKWILVGDDGQHDPIIYGTVAAEHPERIAGIAIRNLSPSEHVLSHGTAFPIERLERTDVPMIEGADGFALLKQIDELR